MSSAQYASRGESIVLNTPEFLADPFPFYARLRREAPVYRARMSYAGDAEFYLLARYRDCVDLTTGSVAWWRVLSRYQCRRRCGS